MQSPKAGDTAWFASHELRTPLNAIRSAAELLIDGSLGGLSSESREIVGLICEAACELDAKFGRLENLARVEMHELSLESTAIAELILTSAIHSTGHTPEDFRAYVDRDLLQRAIEFCRACLAGDGTSIEIVHAGGTCDRLQLKFHPKCRSGADGNDAIGFEIARRTAERAGARLHIDDDGHLLIDIDGREFAPVPA